MIDFVHNFQVFLLTKYRKKMSLKMRNVLKLVFAFGSFFVRFAKKKMYEIFANLILTLTSEIGDSIRKHPGSGDGAPPQRGG